MTNNHIIENEIDVIKSIEEKYNHDIAECTGTDAFEKRTNLAMACAIETRKALLDNPNNAKSMDIHYKMVITPITLGYIMYLDAKNKIRSENKHVKIILERTWSLMSNTKPEKVGTIPYYFFTWWGIMFFLAKREVSYPHKNPWNMLMDYSQVIYDKNKIIGFLSSIEQTGRKTFENEGIGVSKKGQDAFFIKGDYHSRLYAMLVLSYCYSKKTISDKEMNKRLELQNLYLEGIKVTSKDMVKHFRLYVKNINELGYHRLLTELLIKVPDARYVKSKFKLDDNILYSEIYSAALSNIFTVEKYNEFSENVKNIRNADLRNLCTWICELARLNYRKNRSGEEPTSEEIIETYSSLIENHCISFENVKGYDYTSIFEYYCDDLLYIFDNDGDAINYLKKTQYLFIGDKFKDIADRIDKQEAEWSFSDYIEYANDLSDKDAVYIFMNSPLRYVLGMNKLISAISDKSRIVENLSEYEFEYEINRVRRTSFEINPENSIDTIVKLYPRDLALEGCEYYIDGTSYLDGNILPIDFRNKKEEKYMGRVSKYIESDEGLKVIMKLEKKEAEEEKVTTEKAKKREKYNYVLEWLEKCQKNAFVYDPYLVHGAVITYIIDKNSEYEGKLSLYILRDYIDDEFFSKLEDLKDMLVKTEKTEEIEKLKGYINWPVFSLGLSQEQIEHINNILE